MRFVPTAEEQQWLLTSLGALIQKQGHETFLANPILKPNQEFFPEHKGKASYLLDRVTHRLLQYAGLGSLKVEFEVFDAESASTDDDMNPSPHGIAAYFRGIDEGVCYFGLNRQLPSEAEYLAGVMSHEVAHAFRFHHGLASQDSVEEFLTDLTTVYLGFGLLSLNASWIARSGTPSNRPFIHAWSVGSSGYLPPQALAFLLAVQMRMRGCDSREENEICRLCEPNQAEFLRASLQGPAADDAMLATHLDLESRSLVKESKSLAEIQRPLPEFIPWEERGEAYLDPARFPNARWPVFRLQRSRADFYGLVGLILALPLAIAESVRTESLLTAGTLLVIGAGVGIYLGRKRRRDVCSDESCNVTLPAELERCPGCGGQIMGRIRRRKETMDAIDRLIAEGRWEDNIPGTLEENEKESPE